MCSICHYGLIQICLGRWGAPCRALVEIGKQGNIMKKTKKQQPARRKRTRAAAKAIRQVAGKAVSFETWALPRFKRMGPHLDFADEAHWKGERSDASWTYETALVNALDADCHSFSPFHIDRLRDEAEAVAQACNPDDPDSVEPLQESVDLLVGQLVERGLLTFDGGTGLVSVVPLPGPEKA